jgi:hypothetical protein
MLSFILVVVCSIFNSSGRVSSSCSTWGTRCVTPVTNLGMSKTLEKTEETITYVDIVDWSDNAQIYPFPCGHCLCIRFTASEYPLTPSNLYVYMHLIIYMLKLQRYNIGASSRLLWTTRLHFNIKFQISLTNINCQSDVTHINFSLSLFVSWCFSFFPVYINSWLFCLPLIPNAMLYNVYVLLSLYIMCIVHVRRGLNISCNNVCPILFLNLSQ